jgi:biotin carboxylase
VLVTLLSSTEQRIFGVRGQSVGGSLVLIGCGVQEVEAVRTAKLSGFHTIVIDRDPRAAGFALADEAVVLDGKDIEGITAWVLLNQDRFDIRGIWTSVNLTTTVAAVASACALPGIPVATAVAAQNKVLMKRIMVRDGIPTPRFVEASTLEEARAALAELGGTAFLKSVDSFGGQGCGAVGSDEELEHAFADSQRASSYPVLLMEEIVKGTFHDLNGIYYDQRFYPAGIVDSFFTEESPCGRVSPIEHYVECPSTLEAPVQEELFRQLEECTRALGIDFGPVGGDAILTDNGPMLLEVAPRFHGAANSLWMVPRATGMDPVRAAQKVIAGEPLDEDLICPKGEGFTLNKLLFVPPGRVTRVSGLEEARSMPGVFNVFQFHRKGDVVPVYNNSTGVSCSLFVSGDSLTEARTRLREAEAVIRIETEPGTR